MASSTSLPHSCIHFYRHAPSTWNLFHDLSKNVPVVDRPDVKQLCANMNRLPGKYHLVICSTLRRARETLLLSNIQYVDVMYTDYCREHLTGCPGDHFDHEEVKEESEEEYRMRYNRFIELLIRLQPIYPRIAVIGHSCFFHTLTGKSLQNCGMVEFVVPKGG